MSTTGTPTVGDEVREIMRQRGITITDLAQQLGWGRMTLQRRLADTPEFTLSEYQQVARALGLRADFRVEQEEVDGMTTHRTEPNGEPYPGGPDPYPLPPRH